MNTRKILRTFKKTILPYIYLFLVIGLMSSNPLITWIPKVFAAEPSANANGNAQALLLSIQYGQGGAVQEYPISSGDAVFIQAGAASNPSLRANPQEVQQSDAYKQQVGVLSQQIAQKIEAIRKKQQELDAEVYPVYQTPLAIEKMNLENDLKILEARKEQLSSQRTAKESLKPTQMPAPPTQVAQGFTVKAEIVDAQARLSLQTQGESPVQTVIQGPLNEWLQIFSAEKGSGENIWAKVSPR